MARNVPNKHFDYNIDRKSPSAKKLQTYIKKDQNYMQTRIINDIATRITLWFKYCRCNYLDTHTMTYPKIVNNFLKDYNFSLISKEKLLNDIELILKNKYEIDIISKEPLILYFKGTFNEFNI